MQNVRKPYDDEWHNVWKVTTLGLRDDDKAQRMLHSAAQLVIPIMKKRRWRVAHMMEFVPKNNRLLGLNVNRGLAVKIRLRRNREPGHFLSYMDILGQLHQNWVTLETLSTIDNPLDGAEFGLDGSHCKVDSTVLHELVHNSYGPHNAAFYKCLDSIKAECEILILGHPLSLDLINRRSQKLDESPSTASDKLVEFSAEVGQKKPRKARTPRIKRGRGRKLGGDKKAYAELPQRELARMAAERRMRDAQLCDTHDDGPDDSPPIESSSSETEHKRKRIKRNENTGDLSNPASSSAVNEPARSSRTNAKEERKIIELSDSSSDEDAKETGIKCPWCNKVGK